MISASEAVKVINSHRNQSVVVSTSKALREWNQISNRRDLDVDILDCMDKVADVALGISIARPDKKILILDSDSALRTNLSAMITTAHIAPRNLIHFLFEDCDYSSTDGLPIQGLDSLDLVSFAREAGYAQAHSFDDLEDFALSLEDMLEEQGPVFIALKVSHTYPSFCNPDRNMAESLSIVRDMLSKIDSRS